MPRAPSGWHELNRKYKTYRASLACGVINPLNLDSNRARSGDPLDAAAIEDTIIEDVDRLFAVNVRAPFFLVQQLLAILGEGDSVILVSSLAAHAAVGTLSAYAMTKAANDTMVEHFAATLRSSDIRVNAVAPGVVETDMSSFARTAAGRILPLAFRRCSVWRNPTTLSAPSPF